MCLTHTSMPSKSAPFVLIVNDMNQIFLKFRGCQRAPQIVKTGYYSSTWLIYRGVSEGSVRLRYCPTSLD